MDHKTFIERAQQEFRNEIVEGGDIVKLFNREYNGYFAVKVQNNFSSNLTERPVLFELDNREPM